MVPMVEAFHLEGQDFTVIGNKYGDIYEKQFEFAKNSKLNKSQVPAWYRTYIKPTLTMIKPKL